MSATYRNGMTMLTRIWRDYRRHRAVRRLRADESADPTLDRLVELAAQAFDAPIAVVSLIDRHTQWIKAVHGLPSDPFPRCDAFCHHALDRADVLEVCAPGADARFAGLPAVVGDPHLRYYIGAAVQSGEGVDVGTLCVADTRPRAPASADQRAYLRALARRVTEALEMRPDFVAVRR